MPGSAKEGRELMFGRMYDRAPRSVLDIGAGSGTYGRLFRNTDLDPYLIGVEVWGPYVNRFSLYDVYDHVIVHDIRTMPMWPRADIVVLGDVLEHMDERDAVQTWGLACRFARKAVYLSIPIVHSPQGAVHDNPFETHVVPDWTHEKVMDSFPGITHHWRGTIVGRYEARLP